jgi:hypothetical protein
LTSRRQRLPNRIEVDRRRQLSLTEERQDAFAEVFEPDQAVAARSDSTAHEHPLSFVQI